MPKKEKTKLKQTPLKLPAEKETHLLEPHPASIYRAMLPHLLIIGICVALYYAMISFYLFFTWGFYIYYILKFIIAFELLSVSRFSPLLPFSTFLLGLTVLFTKSGDLHTLMNPDTAWELVLVSLLGLFVYGMVKRRS